MRYLCGSCHTHFRLDGMALNSQRNKRDQSLVCPHCKTKVVAQKAYSPAWWNGVCYWVLSVVVAMYLVQLMVNAVPSGHYFYSSLCQVLVALMGFKLYLKMGTIYTRPFDEGDA